MWRARWAVVFCMGLLGCPEPESPRPEPSPIETATPPAPSAPEPEPMSSALRGGWRLAVSSEAPGLNPDAVDTPEARAKMFFDHRARVEGDRVVVEHGGIGRSWTAEEAAAGKELEALVLDSDWAALAKSTGEESEGGTVFRFEVEAGGRRHELRTSNLDAHPELRRIVEIVQRISGMP